MAIIFYNNVYKGTFIECTQNVVSVSFKEKKEIKTEKEEEGKNFIYFQIIYPLYQRNEIFRVLI